MKPAPTDAAGDAYVWWAVQQSRIEQVAAAFQKRLPVVICPGCNKPMRPGKPKAITKKSVTKDLADITYVCESCGTATERTMKEEVARRGEGGSA